MPQRKSFLIRTDARMLDAIRRWAEDDLRSLNGQIEFLLRKALQEAGRLKSDADQGELPEPAAEE